VTRVGSRLAPRDQRRSTAFRYEQVIDLVLKLIDEGGLKQGDQLPTNFELGKMAAVSLMSVRRALDELEREGRVHRHQGLGTFVAAGPIITDPLRVGDLHATLVGEPAALTITTELLDVQQAFPGRTIARLLRCGEHEPVWHVRRLRRIGDSSSILEEATVPVALVHDLDRTALSEGASLYRLLAAEHGLVDAREEQYLSFTLASANERRVLKLPTAAHVARLRGVSLTASGIPFDCFQHVYPAADFAFWISSGPGGSAISPNDVADWYVRSLEDKAIRLRHPLERAQKRKQ
jgi:DNA-binding GntR family transcriptional regulator